MKHGPRMEQGTQGGPGSLRPGGASDVFLGVSVHPGRPLSGGSVPG